MKKLIPFLFNLASPYFVLVLIALMYGQILPTNTFWLTVLFVLLYFVAGMVFSVIACIKALTHQWESKPIIKAVAIVKLLQIPAYIGIFLYGVICVLSIWGIGFAVLVWLFDCMFIFATGIVSVAGAVRGYQEKILSKKATILCSILSFVFCIDVFVAIYVWAKSRKIVPCKLQTYNI